MRNMTAQIHASTLVWSKLNLTHVRVLYVMDVVSQVVNLPGLRLGHPLQVGSPS